MLLVAKKYWSASSNVITTSTPYLPFDMPQLSYFDTSNSIYAPHVMATWRRRVQNKNIETDPTSYEQLYWVPPGGIEGAGQSWATDHRVYGGYFRNMPRGVDPGGSDWSVQDKRWELRQMRRAGMPHMTIDILGEDTFPHVQEWGAAALAEGMSRAVIAMPDASVSIVRNGPANLVNYLKQMFGGVNADAFYKHTDGRWLIMPYGPEFAVSGGTEQQIIDYWVAVLSQLQADGYPTAIWPCFSRAWTSSTEFTANTFTKPALQPYLVGLGRWGIANPDETNSTNMHNAGAPAYSRTTYGMPFSYGLRVEDTRPRSNVFYEAGGWDNLVSANNIVINNLLGNDIVQVCTWNDWAEQSSFAPSILHGWTSLDVQSYYNCIKRIGYTPPIIRDTLYLAHRVHQGPLYATQPTYTAGSVYTSRMARSGSTPERNVIDVLVFATAAGQVEITTGSGTETFNVAAGVSRVTTALVPGNVSCRMKRSSTLVPGTEINSPWPVNFTTQLVQDMSYRRMGSRDSVTRPDTQ